MNIPNSEKHSCAKALGQEEIWSISRRPVHLELKEQGGDEKWGPDLAGPYRLLRNFIIFLKLGIN